MNSATHNEGNDMTTPTETIKLLKESEMTMPTKFEALMITGAVIGGAIFQSFVWGNLVLNLIDRL